MPETLLNLHDGDAIFCGIPDHYAVAKATTFVTSLKINGSPVATGGCIENATPDYNTP